MNSRLLFVFILILFGWSSSAIFVPFAFFRPPSTPPATYSAPVECPAGYVGVPADGVYTNESFCVMKFEAKAETNAGGSFDADGLSVTLASYKPASVAANQPWRTINRDDAIAECQSLGAGYDLMTNAQWQTIARNLEAQGTNWTGASVGSGCMIQGNNGETTCGYDGADPEGGTGRNSRAKLVLSTGAEIFDVAGNVWEWMNDDNATNYGADTVISSITDGVYTTTGTLSDGVARNARGQFGPSGTGYTCNVGNNYCGFGEAIIASTAGLVIRGGDYAGTWSVGVYDTYLALSNPYNDQFVGFRCVYTGGGDPYQDNVVLLIQPDENSTTIIDSSFSAHTVSAQNGVALSTSVSDPWGGSRKVIAFDGSDDYLSIPDSNDWNVGSGDFTYEFWVYFNTLGASANSIFWSQYLDGANFNHGLIDNNSNYGLVFDAESITFANEGTDRTSPTGAWSHYAFVRFGSNFNVYLNGTSVVSTTSASALNDVATSMTIGSFAGGAGVIDGYLGSVRFTKGVVCIVD